MASFGSGVLQTANLADSAVTSAKIADGTIVNADINSSAAIVTSKLETSGQSTISLTAGESIAANSATMIGRGTATGIVLSQENINATQYAVKGGTAGAGETEQACAQSINGADVEAYIQFITLLLDKNASPTDNLVVEIRTVSQSGALQATATIAASTIDAAGAYYTLAFDTPVFMTAGTTYFIVVTRSGARHTTNFIYVSALGTGAYAGGIASTRANAAWSDTASGDFYFKLHTYVNGQLYLSRANASADVANAFVGFAPSAIASGASGTSQVRGLLGGFSGLTPGAIYFISNTAGAIATSAGTNSRISGIAISATQLLIRSA